MRRRLERFGLSVPEYTALSILAAVPGLSNAQLARRSLITPPAMLEVLASLERRGLVERHADPQHGRIRRAELTEEGTRRCDASSRDIDHLSDQLLAAHPRRRARRGAPRARRRDGSVERRALAQDDRSSAGSCTPNGWMAPPSVPSQLSAMSSALQPPSRSATGDLAGVRPHGQPVAADADRLAR